MKAPLYVRGVFIFTEANAGKLCLPAEPTNNLINKSSLWELLFVVEPKRRNTIFSTCIVILALMGEQFIYHRVVENLQGTILYPLNQLKDLYPETFDAHKAKYEGREHVLESRIPPPLDCLWNDVLHFTAVPPTTLYENIKNAGFDADELVWKKWFKVPASLLDPEKTLVCLYRRDVREVPEARDFNLFHPVKIPEYGTVPSETIEYYKEQHELGRRPLFFHHVPHILFKGTINTKMCEVIELK
jgi:hypothetical protein